ncbi:hypothetical protein [Saccharopolyspora griseoalba]|uniref:Uncharacterized protein n=1 Tax=Saccharopolyspora griseoalba TaxID=1431848 RepID=A0ABW2LNI3_9PSEU
MHQTDSRTDLGPVRFLAAFASLGAGLIHLAVTPDHWQAWTGYGVFFLSIALFQAIWATAAIWAPRPPLLALGLAANAATIALWGTTRLWGPPLGPEAWAPESVGVPDALTVALEAVAVLAVVWLLLPRAPAAISRGAHHLAVGATFAAVAAVTAPGVVAAFGHDHGSHGEHAGHEEHADHSGHREPGHHAPAAPPDPASVPPPPPGDGHAEHEHHGH